MQPLHSLISSAKPKTQHSHGTIQLWPQPLLMLPSSLTLNLMPPPVSWPTHPTLLPAETCYSTFDRELLGVYLSIIQFHHFLEGRLLTDHKPLTYALNVRSDRHSPRQARHLDYIAQFTQWYRQCSCWRPVSNWNERPPLWPTSHWPTNPCTPILTILNSRGRTSRPTGLNRPLAPKDPWFRNHGDELVSLTQEFVPLRN